MGPKRKRAVTRKVKITKRAKPVLPDGDLNTSMSIEEQETKLNNYIQDFVLQVKNKREQMITCIKNAKTQIGHAYKSATIELIKSVRKMTFEEFLKNGGTVDLVINAQVTASITSLADGKVSRNKTFNNRQPLTSLQNNLDNPELITGKGQVTSNVQTVGGTTRKGKRNTTKAPATATRSSRRLQGKMSAVETMNNNVTPMPNFTTLSSLTKDMLITPKFDPRFPIPARRMREPKPGERVISMTGSPLTNHVAPMDNSAPRVIIPLTGGKTMQVCVDRKTSINEQDIDVANDRVAQENIKLLQEKLSKMLTMPK